MFSIKINTLKSSSNHENKHRFKSLGHQIDHVHVQTLWVLRGRGGVVCRNSVYGDQKISHKKQLFL